METMRFGERLAEYAVNKKCDYPQFYRTAWLHYLAVALSGAHEEAVDRFMRYAIDSPGSYQPLGRHERVTLKACIMADCLSSSILAYDDIHFQTTTHPSGVIGSVLLGLARTMPLSLEEIITALCIGMEIECRVAIALFHQNSKGWYPTGIAGVIGAAAAAGRIYHFNQKQMVQALALAATYASGVRGTHGSQAGSYVPSIAAGNGYEAADLIRAGFTCHPHALDGELGMIHQVSETPAFDEALKDLDTHYVSMETSCKPYPYGFIAFAPIACVKHSIKAEEIHRVILDVSPRVKALGDQNIPHSHYDAFVNIRYIIAAILIDSSRKYQPVSSHFVISEEEQWLMKRITLRADKTLHDADARMIIETADETYTCEVRDAYGSKENPMRFKDIMKKVKTLDTVSQQVRDMCLQGNCEDFYQFFIKNH